MGRDISQVTAVISSIPCLWDKPHFYAGTFETCACNVEFVAEPDVDVRDICFRGSLLGPGGQSLDELFCRDEETGHRRLDITHLRLLVSQLINNEDCGLTDRRVYSDGAGRRLTMNGSLSFDSCCFVVDGRGDGSRGRTLCSCCFRLVSSLASASVSSLSEV